MENRTISLSCGPRHYSLRLREGLKVQIAEPNHVKAVEDPQACIRKALDHPVGSDPIEKIVKEGQSVCIIVDDMTRMTPVPIILRELLPRLEGAGVRREDIVIVVALGSHRKMTPDELADKVGAEIMKNYRVLNSEFRDPDGLMEVGKSQLGTPIRVFRPAMEADIRIGIGTIVPHGCMGWSGGAKILYPGITSGDIVSEFHSMQGLEDEILFGKEDCRIRLAVEEWAKQIGLHFIINTILTGDLKLYRAVAGDYVKAHRAGVAYGKEVCGTVLDERPDVILATSMPLTADFWQCTKALYSSSDVIRKGGTLLLLAPCLEGIGPHPEVTRYIGMDNGEEALREKLARGETGEELLVMAVGVSMSKMNRNCKISLISDGLSAEQISEADYGWYPERELQAAFDAAIGKTEDPKVLIVTEGCESVLSLRQ